MKIIKLLTLFFLIVIVYACSTTTAEKLQETDEEATIAVEKVVQNLFDEVWSDYDEAAITKYQTDDFLLLEHGEVWNNDTIANWCKSAKKRELQFDRINNFERIAAKRNGDKLWLAYHNYGTFKLDTVSFKSSWLGSVVAVKKDSVWKLELMHSTRQSND
ncbi:nuclear transport factor 2 family protein [Nonlabens ulvanivorans]|uniref:nuclear transport factor 2 family protein n=1 Tax=Nonlabens ulvanivorans TaxID=906888 RepID=UPI0037CAD426